MGSSTVTKNEYKNNMRERELLKGNKKKTGETKGKNTRKQEKGERINNREKRGKVNRENDRVSWR